MDTSFTHDRTPWQKRLFACEQTRNDVRLRELFWGDGERWRESLRLLARHERASDAAYRAEIAQARKGSAYQLELEAAWNHQMTSDIQWMAHFEQAMQATAHHWQRTRTARRADADLLRYHLNLIQRHILRREMMRLQLHLELYEQRRLAQGRIDHAAWRETWERWLAVSAKLDVRSEGERTERLAWLENLHAMQRATCEHWGWRFGYDRRHLRACMAESNSRIRAYRHAGTPSLGRLATAVMSSAAVALLAVVVMSWNAHASAAPKHIVGAAQPQLQGVLISNVQQPTSAPVPATATPVLHNGALQDSLYNQGMVLLANSQCGEAIETFRRAYDAAPLRQQAYMSLDSMAFCQFDLNQLKDAEASWRQALALEPNSPDVNAGLGMLLYINGDQETGLRFYNHAVQLQQGYTDLGYLRSVVFWSEHSLIASAPLRELASVGSNA